MGRASGQLTFDPAASAAAEQCRVRLYDRADPDLTADSAAAGHGVEHPTLFAQSVEWRVGAQPGRARLWLETLDRVDAAPRLSFHAGGGAAQLHRVGRRVALTLTPGDLPVFHGTLVHQETDLAADRIEYTALDDRWLLSGVPVYGCIVASPIDGSLTYAQGWPLVFNPDGLKNCRDVNGRPVFTHTAEWAAPAAVDESPGRGEALTQARHWTVADILQYLRFAYFDAAAAPLFAAYPFVLRAQAFADRLQWPANLHAQLAPGDPADPAAAANRTPRQLDLDGLDLTAALTAVLTAAGPCALGLQPTATGNRLQIVATDSAARAMVDDAGGIDLPRPVNPPDGTGLSASAAPGSGLTGGVHHLDLEQTFQSTVTMGDRVRLESRFAQTSATTGDLLPAWTDDEETAFKNSLAAAADPITALHAAMRAWPRVGQAYRIHPDAVALDAGGIFTGLPRVYCARTPDPVLLSTDRTADSLQRVLRLPISVEAQDFATGGGAGDWHPALIADGLTVDALGTIYLPGLLLADGHRSNHNGSFDAGLQFRNLRINCAVPLDHALTYVVAAADSGVPVPGSPAEITGPTQGFGGSVYARSQRAATRIAPGLERQTATRTHNRYRHEYRFQAWPLPDTASAGGTAQTGLYRSDLTALNRAAQEQARVALEPAVRFAPELAGISPGLTPGTVIRQVVAENNPDSVAQTATAGATATAPLPTIDAVITRVIFEFAPAPRTRLFCM